MKLIGCGLKAAAVMTLALSAGCHHQTNQSDGQASRDAEIANADRGELARLIGVWTFEGWSIDQNGGRQTVSGVAAGTVEDTYLVLMDFQASEGQFRGQTGRKAGSMLFASEPGIGMTVTAWGDASPLVCRLSGRRDGKRFLYTEMPTPHGRNRHSLTITFETDDRWVVEIRGTSDMADSPVASYRFTRMSGDISPG